MRAEVVVDQRAVGVGHIEEKWALMNSGFAEEEGGQKLVALRRLGLARLQDRLADLGALLGRAPKALEWFRRLVKCTQAELSTTSGSMPLAPVDGRRQDGV
jgi:hypothetical protein